MKTSRVDDASNSVTDFAAGNPQQTQQEPLPARTMRPRILTIEKTGDAYVGKVRPRIRLGGRWLEKAGFKPGHRVQVEWIDDGVISLRLTTAARRREARVPMEWQRQTRKQRSAEASSQLATDMNGFRFEPGLFNHRAEAMAALAEAGYEWLTEYSAVDLLHDQFGLEVCGIPKKEDALRISRILQRTFPGWRFADLDYEDGDRDRGWRAAIYRDPEKETPVVQCRF